MNERIVSGCGDCPFCEAFDMASGYGCNLLPPGDNNFIERNRMYQPKTPDWCPLKISSITVSIKSNSKTDDQKKDTGNE